ncbi:MAG: GMC oxidoreductase [Thermodesulfobacteriota bacterium]
MEEFDFVVVGSGFGGAVSALRLTEKGYRVAVVEQGTWVGPEEMERAADSIKDFFWLPALGFTGYFAQHIFRHALVVSGVGVGGGSIVYAAVLLKPKSAFFKDPAWAYLAEDWEAELYPHYETASRMLGVQKNPHLDVMDEYLRETAEAMGSGETFGAVDCGIFFGEPKKTVDDPYFGGQGPERTGCEFCGECMGGCSRNSKNSLDKNYLYLAQRAGAAIFVQRKVEGIIPQEDGSYVVTTRHPMRSLQKCQPIKARKVVLAAGVVGTLDILFRCRDITRTLPNISRQLGNVVRTNSEAIVAVLCRAPKIDLSRGTAISSDFYPDTSTHITQNRFPRAFDFMRCYLGPMADEPNHGRRAASVLMQLAKNPVAATAAFRARNFRKRLSVLSVMQHLDNQLSFTYGRSALPPFDYRLRTRRVPGKEAPVYLPVANRAARAFARVVDGYPMNSLSESLANLSGTAHILGGCHMGRNAQEGVVATNNELFGHPGIYVVDGAAVSANVGVNPSLTIAALAERAMSLIPAKEDASSCTVK